MECRDGRRTWPRGPKRAHPQAAAHCILAMACCIAIWGAYVVDDAHAQSDTQTITQILDDTGAIREMLDVGRPDTGGTDSQMLEQILDDTGAIRQALGIEDDAEAEDGSDSIFDFFGSIFGGEPDAPTIPQILDDTGAIRQALDMGRPDTGGSEPQMLAQIRADTGAIRQALDAQSQRHDPSAGPPTLKPVSAAFGGQGGFGALAGSTGLAVFDADGRTYAIVTGYHESGIQIMDITDPASPAPVATIYNSQEGFEALTGPLRADIFDSGGRVYAAVAGAGGLQIIDVTHPATPAPASATLSGSDDLLFTNGLWGLDIFYMADRTYAIATSSNDHTVLIMDVTDPAEPVFASASFDGVGGFEALEYPIDVAVFDAGAHAYAVVAAREGSSIQIMDVTNPTDPVPVSAAFDDTWGFTALAGAAAVEILHSEGRIYAIVAGTDDSGVQIIDVTDPAVPAAISAAFDGSGGALFGNFDALLGAGGIDIFDAGGRVYAIVTALRDNGVQIIDVTDPGSPSPVSAVFDGEGGFEALAVPYEVKAFDVGARTYAIVSSGEDNGVQIMDITDPGSPTPVSAALDGYPGPGGFSGMGGASHVAAYEMDGHAYAIVTLSGNHGVQIIDVTDPAAPTPASAVFDGRDGFEALHTATGLDVFGIEGRAYAIVGSMEDSGVQIIDVTDPAAPTPVSAVFDNFVDVPLGFNGLAGVRDVQVFWSGGRAYAIASAFVDDAIQIMDITNPAAPAPVFMARDNEGGFDGMNGAGELVLFTAGGSPYAVVTSMYGGFQTIGLADPTSPTPVSLMRDDQGGIEALDGAGGVDVFETEGRVYAIVAASDDDGVQIVDMTNPARPVPVSAVFDGQGGFDFLNGAVDVQAFEAGGGVYAIVSAMHDDGVQLINVTDPASPAPVSAALDGMDGFAALNRPLGMDVFETGGSTYVVVASSDDAAIQIIKVSSSAKP